MIHKYEKVSHLYSKGSLVYFFDVPRHSEIFINVLEVDETGDSLSFNAPTDYKGCLDSNSPTDGVMTITEDSSSDIFSHSITSYPFATDYTTDMID